MEFLPAAYLRRDRGYLWVLQRVFLTWLRKLDFHIRSAVNESSYQIHGNNLVKVTHQIVKCVGKLKGLFVDAVCYALARKNRDADIETIDYLYNELTRKIINARVNEFLVARYARQSTKTDKGGFTIRDTLYGIIQ